MAPRLPIVAQHAEWLRLVEPSGAFLSLEVLARTFPQGLDAHDATLSAELRIALEEWQENAARKSGPPSSRTRPDDAVSWHRAWIDWVLGRVLELPDDRLAEGPAMPRQAWLELREFGETLRADRALLDPERGRPRMFLWVLDPGTNLERPLTERRYSASHIERMRDLLHATRGEVSLGLVTNGEHWALVHVPGTTGRSGSVAHFYASLWTEEPLTFRAFRSLLSAQRFFNKPDPETLEGLLEQSSADQQEVTEQLGMQVRRAVEVLVHAMDRADRERGGSLLRGVPERVLYEAALAVMMRLVFVLSAEERGLLPLGESDWDASYAVGTLRDALATVRDHDGEEVLERRYAAWPRILATFRAIHGGVDHDTLRLPAYGGGLFDPDRFPFLEGRAAGTRWEDTLASPLPLHDRTVLHVLDRIQMLETRVPGGVETRRLSFKALDVEQIGHVYEGLLDHTAVRTREPVLGLAGPEEPEIAISRLEAWRAQGTEALLDALTEATGRARRAVEKALSAEGVAAVPAARLRTSCGNDAALEARVAPWAALLRSDAFGDPVVVPAGSVYVTQGSDRRSTGTHYTPRILAEEMVTHTLAPCVFDGVVDGKPEGAWVLRAPAEILALRVCDAAMGSGAFLVAACRYLAHRLLEAWERLEAAHPDRVLVSPTGDLSEGRTDERALPKDPDERWLLALRAVADRCLYGVDKNPLAVEIAKVSLWLVTMQKGRPFEFLDHALRSGDSLLGLTSRAQIDAFHPRPTVRGTRGIQLPQFAERARQALERALALREQLARTPTDTAEQVQTKARLLAEAERVTAQVRDAADELLAAALRTASKGDRALEEALKEAASVVGARAAGAAPVVATRGLGKDRTPFHWLIEFPEVFAREDPGFDAIVGNPPFQGGQKITGALGTDYRDFLVAHVADGRRGSADLCGYFFLRVGELLRPGAMAGLISTNTIAQGDTREVGLDALVAGGSTLVRAVSSEPWPGGAALEVSKVWWRKGPWAGGFVLDGRAVSGVTPMLTERGAVSGTPFRLAANAGKSFIGSYVLGMGFVLEPEEAAALIAKDPRNKDVLFPYLNGEDLNSRPDQSASRWVINFHDWPEERAATYPDCYAIVREKVKPEREALGDGNPTARDRARRWWQFARPTLALYEAIAGMERVLVTAQTSRTQQPVFVSNGHVLAHKLVVFASDRAEFFALVSATLHLLWVFLHGSSLRTDAVYTPSDCFETFPFPPESAMASLEDVGARYERARAALMAQWNVGLTKLYNRFHDPQDGDAGIAGLRSLHAEMDRAVLHAYGWDDLDPGHGFHETKQGVRYTFDAAARTEVLARLLSLNHARHAEEVAAGLHDGPKGKKRAARSAVATAEKASPKKGGTGQGSLF